MAEGETKLTAPDLAKGILLESLPDGQMRVGHAHEKAVLLVRTAGDHVCSWHLADIKVETENVRSGGKADQHSRF